MLYKRTSENRIMYRMCGDVELQGSSASGSAACGVFRLSYPASDDNARNLDCNDEFCMQLDEIKCHAL
jgi:hypothetical protein